MKVGVRVLVWEVGGFMGLTKGGYAQSKNVLTPTP